jgi:methionine-rich copper-binding protein CopC
MLTSPDLAAWTRVPVSASGVLHAVHSHEAGLFTAASDHALLLSPDSASAAPPPGQITLSAAGVLAPNVFGFTITGPAGQTVTLERSGNLSDWSALQTFTLTGGAETLEVEIPQPLPSEYFRLRWNL